MIRTARMPKYYICASMRRMPSSLSRRTALRRLAAAGAGALIAPRVVRGQTSAPMAVAGQPVEVAIASISATTVRVTVRPLGSRQPKPNDGALVAAAEGRALRGGPRAAGAAQWPR